MIAGIPRIYVDFSSWYLVFILTACDGDTRRLHFRTLNFQFIINNFFFAQIPGLENELILATFSVRPSVCPPVTDPFSRLRYAQIIRMFFLIDEFLKYFAYYFKLFHRVCTPYSSIKYIITIIEIIETKFNCLNQLKLTTTFVKNVIVQMK